MQSAHIREISLQETLISTTVHAGILNLVSMYLC